MLERASERYEGFAALCADFEQNLHVPLLSQTTQSEGRLCQRAPNFFRMDFTDPEGDEIVADGEHLWLYYPNSQPGQVIQTELANGGAIDFHREFLSNPATRYAIDAEGREDVGGHSTERFRLVPKEPGAYVRATVWVDVRDALVWRVEIEQEGGSVRVVNMSNLDLNPSLDAAYFRFDVPDGVHVARMPGS